jgi:hypothetical protein
MAETGKAGQKTNAAAEGKRMLQEMHDRGVIDLDAPMRQLFDRMDAAGDVQGYEQISGPEADQWWVYVHDSSDGKGGGTTKVLAGDDYKSPDQTGGLQR